MAQRYIPEIRDGDKRVLLIDGKIVPHCLARIPKAGRVARQPRRRRARRGAAGHARAHREIAEALGPVLAKRGLLLVGLDVIGDWLTEVNVTSPTCFREIHDQTGLRRRRPVPRRAGEEARMIGVLIVSHGTHRRVAARPAPSQILGGAPPLVRQLGVSRNDDPDDVTAARAAS